VNPNEYFPHHALRGERPAQPASSAQTGQGARGAQAGPTIASPPSRGAQGGGAGSEDDMQSRIARFVVVAPRHRLEDVVVPDRVRAQIEGLLAKIEHHRTLYEDWGLSAIDPGGRRVAINLFGPPGTGKTMCAEAIAARLGRPILCVSYAELESKYVGETPKNIEAAFSAARTHGAVLFFDEADSILGRRLTSVTQAADHGVNVSRSVMLLQLDRFEGVVVFATNLARNYDGAFVRRILGHVELALPDAPCRARLAERFLPERLPRERDVDPAWIAERSEGLSGGEMLQVVLNAATRAVRRTGSARAVSRADLEAELDAFRAARRAVGLDPGPARSESRPATESEIATLAAGPRVDP
jgi:SpoVK/Ycf46/Vps4 family AAA+-type ATPase